MATATKGGAHRKQGPRTTLRVPARLARLADDIAKSEGATRNEALLQLAVLGARQRSRLQATRALAKRRLTALSRQREKAGKTTAGFPSDEELDSLMAKRTEYYLGG